jgi:hypothetical protein
MTPPHSRSTGNTSFTVYVLGYVLAITALVLDPHPGRGLFTLFGFVLSLGLTTYLLYGMARAVAFNLTTARLDPMPVRHDRQSLSA